MSETKWTKGEWKMGLDDVGDPYIYTDIPPGRVGGETDVIRVLFDSDWGTEEDARLIVAAKRLYAALEGLEKDCTRGMESGDWGNFTADQWPELLVARNALAAARGEVPSGEGEGRK